MLRWLRDLLVTEVRPEPYRAPVDLDAPKRVLCDCPKDGPCAKKCDGAPMSAALRSLREKGYAVVPVECDIEVIPAPARFIDPADVYGLHV